MENQHLHFLTALQHMGCVYSHTWQLQKHSKPSPNSKKTWQQIITKWGHNLTSLSCFTVTVHNTIFVFFTECGGQFLGTVDKMTGEEKPNPARKFQWRDANDTLESQVKDGVYYLANGCLKPSFNPNTNNKDPYIRL